MTYKKERGMGMELKIPENFFVGAAMSGPQTEGAYKTGGRLESIWDTWSDLSISDFYNKVGSYVGNNFYEKYEDHSELLPPEVGKDYNEQLMMRKHIKTPIRTRGAQSARHHTMEEKAR